MKKQYFLGLVIVLTLAFAGVSPVFAHNGEYHATPVEAVAHESAPKVGFFSFLKNLFSFQKDSLTANVITSAQVAPVKISTSEQKVNDQEIKQLTAKLNSIDSSIRTQTTILENSVLSRFVPSKLVSKNTIGKAIEDKNKLLVTLSEKSPKDAIAFIEKNNLVGKKQVVGTPVTKISKKDIVVDIHNKTNYFGTYIDGIVTKTIFSEEFYGLDGQYGIAEISGYQFGNNILITQMGGLIRARDNNSNTSVFDHKFENVQAPKGKVFFDIPIKQFNSKEACAQLQKSIPGQSCNFGSYYDAWGYPVRKNIYQELIQTKKVSIDNTTTFNIKSIARAFSKLFLVEKAIASDNDPFVPGLVNCRVNINVTGYFKAYFEDVAVNNNVGYDDPTYGQARRDTACQVLQDISILIKLDQTNVTPDIIFSVDPGDLPSNALAAASSYFGYYTTGPDNGSVHKYIISRQDPTPGLGNFDAFVITNFGPSIQWDVDSTLNTNTYSLSTTLYHEILHTLGFRGLLNAQVSVTGVSHIHSNFDSFSYKNSSLSDPFIITPGLLNVSVGNPSPWFITNTNVYQGIKNIIGAIPDGVRPVYSPSPWQQGSSLSHFDMNRSGGQVYVMNPSIGTDTTRNIHNHEEEVLCHEGYMVDGMTGCEQPTPNAVDDFVVLNGVSACIIPLTNDNSFVGGTLLLQNITSTTLQTGDVLEYYSNIDCTGLQSNVIGAKSIKIISGGSINQRTINYQNKDVSSNRISFPAQILITTTPQQVQGCIIPPPNMISWWTGDTDASDHLTINNGTLQNGTTISLGYVEDSFSFDGINDYVEVVNHPSLTPSTNKFTFDFWMNPQQVTAAPKMLIYKGKEYRVMSDGANISFEVTNSSTGGRYVTTTGSPLTLNQWNFVVVTFDGSTQSLKIYVNGTLIPTTPNTLLSNGTVSTLINQPTNLRFGSDYSTSNYYKGGLDEIEFFNRVLTQTEISSIYNAGSAGKCKEGPLLEKLILMDGSAYTDNGPPVQPPRFNDVWEFDGSQWNALTLNASWSKRQGTYNGLFFNNKMWVIGGWDYNGSPQSDIWNSTDGIMWTQVSANSPWGDYRIGYATVVFNNKMWVMGGWAPFNGYHNDVWSSSDGITWIRVDTNLNTPGIQDAPWFGRRDFSAVVFNNKIWIMGGHKIGGSFASLLNDVWSSPDGINWTQFDNDQVTPGIQNAPWGPQLSFPTIVFHNKIWVMKGDDGSTDNSIWSFDGSVWTQELINAPWLPRSRYTGAVINNKIWIMGGLSAATISNFGFNLNDVWSSSDGINWTQFDNDPNVPGIQDAPWDPRQDFSIINP